jgi:hypothetical protein
MKRGKRLFTTSPVGQQRRPHGREQVSGGAWYDRINAIDREIIFAKRCPSEGEFAQWHRQEVEKLTRDRTGKVDEAIGARRGGERHNLRDVCDGLRARRRDGSEGGAPGGSAAGREAFGGRRREGSNVKERRTQK